MEVGSTVRHKLTGQLMTITKINKSVAVLKLDIPIFYPANRYFKEHYNDIAICQIINLELI